MGHASRVCTTLGKFLSSIILAFVSEGTQQLLLLIAVLYTQTKYLPARNEKPHYLNILI